jgi:hypothetical protein
MKEHRLQFTQILALLLACWIAAVSACSSQQKRGDNPRHGIEVTGNPKGAKPGDRVFQMASQNIRLEELGILPPVHPGIDRASIGFMKRCRRAGEKTRPLQTEDEQLMQDYFLRLPRSHATSSERVFAQSP